MANPFRREPSRYDPAESASYSTPRPLTAAASRIKLGDKMEADLFRQRQSSQTTSWQTAAWEYYDAISEVKYAFNLVASVVSRIRLYTAVIENPAEQPVPLASASSIPPELADAAERALARLDSAYGGQAGLLRDAALNLSVTGECYLVQVPERPGQGLPETWDIRSTDELHVDQKGNYVIYPRRDLLKGRGGNGIPRGAIELPPHAFAGRIWRAHPRFSEEPDSSMIGLLDLCDELLLLNRTFRSTHRSRLNAGLLYVPDGMSNSASPDPDLFADPEEQAPSPEEVNDEFEEQLLVGMSTPIEDESSASAVVPIIVRGPADLADKLKPIKIERSFDDSMNARSDRVLERILQGLDVPKDTVTGMANVKYSNAIQIDESLYKAHIEPMLLLISDAITNLYLRPYLISQNWNEYDVNRITVWYDPSAVATRNDRAADADSGYEKMAISGETWRRAHGFSQQDAPDPNELVLRMMMQQGNLSPELFEALLRVVAPDIMDAAKAANQANSVAPIPGEAADILNGTPGATADPSAAAPGAPAAPEEALPTPEEEVAPGEDAPPFPLAEPGDSQEPTA
ncbi:portal protein [Microbacterium phage Pumpernickel]|uniref:Portal protein n=1 Tax=Microbacterium phage Pumpernickel TaxID=2885983 RepID=A0AAE9C2V1_9CAUD|nr:portal protein [Microbacterium phage Pumpernickel]UDL15871.1 portal protein [Microbacterium phage Pumpernickel]